MAMVGSYQCEDVIFDIYNSEKVPIIKKPGRYFVTPSRVKAIQLWASNLGIFKISTKEQLNKIIGLGLLVKYND
jgi:hypothetical protein